MTTEYSTYNRTCMMTRRIFPQSSFQLHVFQSLFLLQYPRISSVSYLRTCLSHKITCDPAPLCHNARWVGTMVDSRFPGSHFYMETAENNCTWKRLWNLSLYPIDSKPNRSPTNFLLPGYQKVPMVFPPGVLEGKCDGGSCMEKITVLYYL